MRKWKVVISFQNNVLIQNTLQSKGWTIDLLQPASDTIASQCHNPVQLIWTVGASFPEWQQSTAVVVLWRGLDALTLHLFLPAAAASWLSHPRLLLTSDRRLRCFACRICAGGLQRGRTTMEMMRGISKLPPTAQTESAYQNLMDDVMFIMIQPELGRNRKKHWVCFLAERL